MSKSITLRLATIKDADMLFDWRNDSETRKASHSTSKVVKEDHIAWLTRTLSNVNRQLLIAEENGDPVGTVRADLSENMWELSWTVAPSARGCGVGKLMVALLAKNIPGPIRAEVKVGNNASTMIAEYAGMVFNREVGSVLHYCRGALSEDKV
jgi:RimJ/RimL family protein N-acetyltransferase